MKRLFIALLATLALLANLALPRVASAAGGQSGWGANAGVLQKYTFATIPAERDGYSIWISDGTPGPTCTGGGTGAVAVGINGAWSCLGTGQVNHVNIAAPSTFTSSTSFLNGTSTTTLNYSGQTCTAGTSPCTVSTGVLSGDASAGNVTFNLPTATGSLTHTEACKTDSTANTVSVQPAGADLIDGLNSAYVISVQNQCVKLTDRATSNWTITSTGSLNNYKGPISITGTTSTSNISSVNVNGIDNVMAFGAKGDGTTNDWAALMSAVADACANNKAVLFPPNTYKVLTPFSPACSTHSLKIYCDTSAVSQIATPQGCTIQEGFSGDAGPTIILDHYQEISSLNSGNILSAPAQGSVGHSLSWTNGGTIVPFSVDVSDVLPNNSQLLNGLPAFDVRFWFNAASLNPAGSFGNLIIESAGGVDSGSNNYEACNIGVGFENDGLPNTCQGAFGLHLGTDGKIFGRLYLTTSGLVHVNSGATTWPINTWHFGELSYDGSNVRLIIDGTLRGNQAATGTVIQRADEQIMMGADFTQYLHVAVGSNEQTNGQIFSPEISKVARSTCGGATALGTSCYTNPTAANPGDSNSLFLWNGDLTNLPLNGGIAVPVLEPDRVNGVAMNTTTTTAWLHVRNNLAGGPLGCCSQLVAFQGFTIGAGTYGIDSNAEQVLLEKNTILHANFSGAGGVGLAISSNASFSSTIRDFIDGGGGVGGYLPVAIASGIQEGDNINIGCNGLCMEDAGGTYKDVFTQLSSSDKWSLVHLAGSTVFDNANFDNENGAHNVAVTDLAGGSSLTFIDSGLQPGGTSPTFRLENGNGDNITVLGGTLSFNQTPIIDPLLVGGDAAYKIHLIGVAPLGDFTGNIFNGAQWIGPDQAGTVRFDRLDVDGVSEAASGAKAAQQYNLMSGLHVAGPVVGGLNETGAIKAAQLATPAAPTVTPKGTAGVTTYSYFCVAHDATSTSVPTGATLPSAAGTTTTGNASLSTTNFNQIQCGPQAGVFSWDVLKTNTSTSLALAVQGYQVIVNDTGQATAGYTPPTRNSTGDFAIAGYGAAGTALASPTTGDMSAARSATTGAFFLGSNGSQSLDFGVTVGSRFALKGGPLDMQAAQVKNSIAPTATGDAEVEGSAIGAVTPAAITGTAITATSSISATTNPISTTTGTITSTTGRVGSTGGGALTSGGGTAPTISAGCNGAGVVQPASPMTNTAGHFTTQTAAATTCTLSFSASGPFNAAPDCLFYDNSASITPVAFSTGACSTSTCVVDFASVAAKPIGYICIGH